MFKSLWRFFQKDYFPFAVAYLLANEGGFSERKEDLGGATNFGITQKVLSLWRSHGVSPKDVENLKVDEAKKIYRAWYWQNVGFDLIRPESIATCLLDQGVLNGPQTAIKYAQFSANNCGADLVVDGIVGPLTLAALAKVDVDKFLKNYHAHLKTHFDAIVASKPEQIANYKGWMNRADRLLSLGVL